MNRPFPIAVINADLNIRVSYVLTLIASTIVMTRKGRKQKVLDREVQESPVTIGTPISRERMSN